MTTSATNDLGRHPSKKVKAELLGKTNNKTNKFVVGLWKNISKLWGEIFGTNGSNRLDWYQQGDEKLFHRKDKWKTWVIYKHRK